MADEIIVKYTADVTGFKADMKSAQVELKNTEAAGVDAGKATADSFKQAEQSAVSLKTQLRTLKEQLAISTDPKETLRLAKAAGEVENKLNDAAKAAKIFASESKFEQIGTALGSVGRNLLSLNFKGAAQESKLLVSAVQGLTFKEALSGVKDLGGTLLNLGKALLLNPLFLLAAVIGGIGLALFELKDKIPLVGKALDFIGDIVTKIKNAVTDLTDAVGFTTVATDKAFDRLIAKGKEVDEQRARRVKFQQEEAEKAKEAATKLEKSLQDERDFRTKVLDERLKGYDQVNKKRDADLKAEKDKLDKEEKAISDSMEARFKLNNEFIKAGQKADEKKAKEEIDKEEEKKERDQQILEEEFNLFSQSANALFEYQNQLDDAQIDNLDQSLKRGAISQEQYDKKVAEIKLAQAKREKEQALFNVVLNTAEAVIKAIAASPATFGLPFSAFAIAEGAIQAAIIASRPLPKFAEGTERVVGGQRGVDSVHALLMPDEAVIKANENMAYPGLAKAWNSGQLDQFIMDEFISPKLSEVLNGSFAGNIAKSAKLNGLNEYSLARVMSRNKGVNVQNADYIAKAIAREMKSGNVKRTWSA